MKNWQDLPDDELDRADDLLGQADALLRRHRGDQPLFSTPTPPSTSPAEPAHTTQPPSPAATPAFDDDDLPILTEVVEDLDLPAEIFNPSEALLSGAAVASAAAMPSFVRTPTRESVTNAPPDVPPESGVRPAAVVQQASHLHSPPAPVEQAAPPHCSPSPSAAAAEQLLAERLVELDTAIAREIDEWTTRELPQIIARELDRLGERIQDEALAHLRATLLPEISARVSSLFEERNPEDPSSL